MHNTYAPIIGYTKRGKPIHLLMGGSGQGDNPPPPEGTPPPPPPGGGDNPPPPQPKPFDPITTQDDLNRVIGERLARERAKYDGFDEIKAKADELDRIREGEKSELERQQAAVAEWKAKFEEAEQKRTAAEVSALRATVAAEKNLSPKLAKRLAGSTREEIEADADDLLDAAPPPGPRSPQPNRQQGTPSNPKPGSVESGRERYLASKGGSNKT